MKHDHVPKFNIKIYLQTIMTQKTGLFVTI